MNDDLIVRLRETIDRYRDERDALAERVTALGSAVREARASRDVWKARALAAEHQVTQYRQYRRKRLGAVEASEKAAR